MEPLLSREELTIASQLRDQALESSLAYTILESLTTEVGPRMAGTEGDRRAVLWAEKKFKELGFDKVWIEPVTFPTWIRGEEHAEIKAPFPQPLVVTALGGTVGTGPAGVEAEIVHFNTLEDLIEAPEDAATGKIVFISNRMHRHRGGSGYGKAVGARSKGAIEASKKGAIAVLIRSIGTDDHRFPHTGQMRYEEGVTPIPAAAMSNPDADLMMQQLKRGQPVVVHMRLTSRAGEPYTSHNVIGEIRGTERPDEVILVGGHLDSWDLGTGAVDDGAGCAITMAAAKLIGESSHRPRRTIRVVLFANEEQGLYGGEAYSKAHAHEMERHITAAESDFGAGRIWSLHSLVKPEALAVVDQMTQLMAPLGVTRGGNQAWGGPDILHMKRAGMSVFSLRQDGTDYFDYHHTPDDTLDKVDPESLAQNVACYVVFCWVSAQMQGDFGFNLQQEKEALQTK